MLSIIGAMVFGARHQRRDSMGAGAVRGRGGSPFRIERLKLRSRTAPNAPAAVEISDSEIQAIILLKRRNNPTIPNDVPTLAQAALCLAELGGYTGKSSGGLPGAITLARGLDRVRAAAQALEELVRPHDIG